MSPTAGSRLTPLARSAFNGDKTALLELIVSTRPFLDNQVNMKRPDVRGLGEATRQYSDELLATLLRELWTCASAPEDFVSFMFEVSLRCLSSLSSVNEREARDRVDHLDIDGVEVLESSDLAMLLDDPDISTSYDELPARARQSVILVSGFGLDCDRTSRAVGISPVEVQNECRRAAVRLRRRFDYLVEREAEHDDFDAAPRTGDPRIDALLSTADETLYGDRMSQVAGTSGTSSNEEAQDSLAAEDADAALDELLWDANVGLHEKFGMPPPLPSLPESQLPVIRDDTAISMEELRRRAALGELMAGLLYARRLLRMRDFDALTTSAEQGNPYALTFLVLDLAERLEDAGEHPSPPVDYLFYPDLLNWSIYDRETGIARYSIRALRRATGSWQYFRPSAFYPFRFFGDRRVDELARQHAGKSVAELVSEFSGDPDGYVLAASIALRRRGVSREEVEVVLRRGAAAVQPGSLLTLNDFLLAEGRYREAAEFRRRVLYGESGEADGAGST